MPGSAKWAYSDGMSSKLPTVQPTLQSPDLLVQHGTYHLHHLLFPFLGFDRELTRVLEGEGPNYIASYTPCGKDINALFESFNTLATRLLKEKERDSKAERFKVIRRLQGLAVDVIETASVYAFG